MATREQLPLRWIEIERTTLDLLARKMPDGRMNLAVGVSGGADSTFLVQLLAELQARERRNVSGNGENQPRQISSLTILHVNHGTRGAESDADEDFVRQTAALLKLPLAVARKKSEPKAEDEASLRRARFEIFGQMMDRCGADHLALAHNLDDLAETVLFRMLRGTGLTGIAAMTESTPFPMPKLAGRFSVVRPLLDVGGIEIRKLLNQRELEIDGQFWREDRTNDAKPYARNLIRKRVMPLFKELGYDRAPQHLADLALDAAADASYWEEEVRKFRLILGDDTLSIPALIKCAVPLRRRVLLDWLTGNESQDSDPDKQVQRKHLVAVEQLLELRKEGLPSDRSINLPGGVVVERSRDRLIKILP